jgi:hypothetical protein
VLFAVLATFGLLVVRAIAPGRHALEADVYVLTLGGMALLAVAAWLREVVPREQQSKMELALDPQPPEVPRIADLDRLERAVYMASARSFDLHHRLRPVIREIAAGRLERRGLRLDSGSPSVRELVGDELWELVDPDRVAPENRQSPGPDLVEIERKVERLERL